MSLERLASLSWIVDLYRLGQSTTKNALGNEIYQRILKHIVEGFDARSGSLALANDDRTSLTIVAGIDLPVGAIGKSVAMGEAILGMVAQEGKVLLLYDSAFAGLPALSKRERESGTAPKSAICWPLKIDKDIIGTVSVNRFADQSRFTQEDVDQGTLILDMVSLVLENIKLYADQQRRIEELKEATQRIEDTQNQLLQAEKMASIGQLAAGVAHEINNPIGFVSSNLTSMEKYLSGIFQVLDAYAGIETCVPDGNTALAGLHATKQRADMDFLREDIPALMRESRDGITRIKTIVQNLKDFSHVGSVDEWKWADLHRGIESTLSIGWNELKYKAEVKKDFGDIPEIECLPSQLNQVFLNMLVNAGHAIEGRGLITIRTFRIGDHVAVEISDTGRGIAEENMKRIFDPFFTTKKVGEGTGLGLSLSYGIVKKHNGRIEVFSEIGKGTTFRIVLPIWHVEDVEA